MTSIGTVTGLLEYKYHATQPGEMWTCLVATRAFPNTQNYTGFDTFISRDVHYNIVSGLEGTPRPPAST